MDNIKKAWEIAEGVHKKHTRRDGETPYINHIKNVVKFLKEIGCRDGSIIIPAILHDAVEDADNPAAIMQLIEQSFGKEVAKIVQLLTLSPNQNYEQYIDAIATSYLKEPAYIKIADMIDNLADNPTDKQKSKYLKALPKLLGSLI